MLVPVTSVSVNDVISGGSVSSGGNISPPPNSSFKYAVRFARLASSSYILFAVFSAASFAWSISPPSPNATFTVTVASIIRITIVITAD